MVVEKGFKQTEIGLIPEDWEVKLIGDIAKISMGQSPLSSNYNLNGIGLPLVQGNADIKNRKTIIRNYTSQITKTANEGDIIMSVRAPVGEVAKSTFNCCIGRGVCSIKYFNDYIFQYLIYFENSWGQFSTGSTFDSVNSEQVKSLKLPFPSLSEQAAIANALSDMDALIAQTEKLIEKKKAIKQGVMQDLLKPKAGWVTKKFTDVVNYIHGKAHEQYIVEEGSFEVVNSKFISTNGVVKKYSNQSFLTAKKGDVLTVLSDLPNGKALAKCYYVDIDNKYAVNQRICIWRSSSCYPKFLYYLLNRHEYFMSLDDGVSQTHILNSHIDKFYLSIPQELETQKEVGDMLWDIDLEIKSLELKLNKIKNQKQGMMQSLLTGKIRLI